MDSFADHPAGWRGPELAARGLARALPADELGELERAARAGGGLAGTRLGARLAALRDELEEGVGLALLRGLPVDAWGEELSRAAFLALARGLGTPVSQDAGGAVVFDVRDEGFAPDDPRHRGPSSRKALRFHSDRCDVIAFLCLRPARSGGENQVVSSVRLFEEVRARRPDLLEVLKRPFPYLRHTVDPGNPLPYVELPVFSAREGRFACHLLRVLIDRADADPRAPDLGAEQREALDLVDELAADPALHLSLSLGPGDVLLLENWVTLHRRSAFEDPPEPGRRRHLLRIWLSMPNSRPLDPAFRGHFGSTEAGALRGGLRPSGRDGG